MNALIVDVQSYLVTQTWHIAMLTLAIATIVIFMRNRSAHLRYLLWLVVIAKCLTPTLNTISLEVLPQQKLIASEQMIRPSDAITEDTSPSQGKRNTVASPAPNLTTIPSEGSSTPEPSSSSQRQVHGLLRMIAVNCLVLIWINGVLIYLLANTLRVIRTHHRLTQKRQPLSLESQRYISDMMGAYGLKRMPKIWVFNQVDQPFVWGIFRGSIYVPEDVLEINDPERKKHIFGHEVSHILRHDAFVNLLQVFAQSLFWFHPFVWWANRMIRLEREKCCDEMAIARLGIPAKAYSASIVDAVVRIHGTRRPAPSLAIAGPAKTIEERMRTMLRPGKKFYAYPGIFTLLIVTLMIFLTAPTVVELKARAVSNTQQNTPRRKFRGELLEAAAIGDLEKVKSLVAEGAGINDAQWDRWKRTPLHMAAHRGKHGVVEFLLAEGANVNASSEGNHTPLHLAANAGHRESVEILIAKQADLHIRDDNGLSPLGAALMTINPGSCATTLREPDCRQKAISVAETLIEKGATVSPLHWAAFMGNIQKVRQLLSQTSDVNAKDLAFDNATPLHMATLGEHVDVIKLLVDRGADINSRTEAMHFTPLHMATSVRLAEVLITSGANVNGRDNWANYTPLHLAAIAGDLEMIDLLIAKGAGVNIPDPTPLAAIAIGAGQALFDKPPGSSDLVALKRFLETRVTAAEALVAAGADCSILGSSTLHQATNADARNWVRLLLKNGLDANGKVQGRTPLHVMAGQLHNKDMVEILLAHNADVNAKDSDGATPLRHARVRGNTAIADLLVKHGGIEQYRPLSLHQAARNGDMKRLNALIAEGGDVNGQSDHWGGTPMHLAAASGKRQVIEFLISKGANVSAQNRYGRTPLDDAVDREQQEIAELLRTAGAKAGPRLSEKSRTSQSFFESATSRFTIPSKRLEIPDDMQACVANLQRIYAALKRYEKDKGDLPHWLSDLVPDYLDRDMLLCPDHPEHRAVFRYFEPQTAMQPGLPCSYGYQFSMSRLPSKSPGSITGRMITRDRKIAQMKLFGDVVPFVRCRAHRVILNLAVNGQVYVSPMVWERIFIRDYRGGQEFEEPSP